MEPTQTAQAGWAALKQLVWSGMRAERGSHGVRNRWDEGGPLHAPLYASRDLPWPQGHAEDIPPAITHAPEFLTPRAPEPMSDEEIARLAAALPNRSTARSMSCDAPPAPSSRDGKAWQPRKAATRPDPGMERALASALARLRALAG